MVNLFIKTTSKEVFDCLCQHNEHVSMAFYRYRAGITWKNLVAISNMLQIIKGMDKGRCVKKITPFAIDLNKKNNKYDRNICCVYYLLSKRR